MEAIELLWMSFTSVIDAIVKAFFSLLPVVEEISGIKDLMYAELLGVPAWVVSVGGAVLSVLIFIARKIIKSKTVFYI